MNKIPSLLYLALLLSQADIASATTLEELEKKMQLLESQLELYREEIELLRDAEQERQEEDLAADFTTPVQINGYVDTEFSDDSRSSAKSGFRLHHLSLFFKKRMSEKWRFFSEIEYEDAPKFEGGGVSQPAPAMGEILDDAKGKLFVEAVNADYLWNPKANFRVGRFFTPAGIWSINHYPPFVPTQIRPAHVRKIFPQVVDGAAAYGTFSVGQSFINYDVYVGNGEGNTGKKDENGDKALGGRAYMMLPVLDYLEIGVSGYTDELNNGDEKTATGVHLNLRSGPLSFQAEVAEAEIDPRFSPSYDRSGYYGQLVYQPGDTWAVGFRHDFYDESDLTVRELTTNSLFVNYHVNADITLKAEYHDLDDDDTSREDSTLAIFSLVYYLGD